MSDFQIPDNIAWICDDHGPRVFALRLPDDVPRVLEGPGAFVFLDVADGLDPLAEGLDRWPEHSDDVRSVIPTFLTQLHEAGLISPVGEAPRPAPSPHPSPSPRATPPPPTEL